MRHRLLAANRLFVVLLFLLSLVACGEGHGTGGTGGTGGSGGSGGTGAPSEAGAGSEMESREDATVDLRLPGGDWGLPTPFTFYPRGPGYIHLSLVYDTLAWKDETGVIPWLAQSWEVSPDGLTWTFHLRPGVKWQDGKPLTAEDVAFTFDYLRTHPVEWFPMAPIANVEVRDGLTVFFRLQAPYAPFLNRMAGSVPIMPKHIWGEVADPRGASGPERAVGSGPYRLVRYDRSQGAYAYEANPGFFLGPPRVRRLLFVPVGDQVAALESGAVDQATVPASLLPRFRDHESFKLLSGPAYWGLTLQFNLDRHPFSLLSVRRAVAHAVDRNALIRQSVPGGLEGARPGSPGYLPPDSDWFDPAVRDMYPHDPARTRELLQSAGVEDRNGDGICEAPDGAPMRFSLVTTAQYLREAEALLLTLRQIGFEIEIKPLDVKAMDALVREGRFDLALTGRGGLGADPLMVLGFGAPRGESLSDGMPPSPEYSDAVERLVAATDPAERRTICNRMQHIYAGELPPPPLYYPVWFIAYRPEVFNGWFHTAGGGIGVGVPLPYNKLAFIRGNKP